MAWQAQKYEGAKCNQVKKTDKNMQKCASLFISLLQLR